MVSRTISVRKTPVLRHQRFQVGPCSRTLLASLAYHELLSCPSFRELLRTSRDSTPDGERPSFMTPTSAASVSCQARTKGLRQAAGWRIACYRVAPHG
jgi:hypothetical protein